jgi:hypothetical protein
MPQQWKESIIVSIYKRANAEKLFEASRYIGLEINAEKTKYMIKSRYSNSGQN